LYGTRPHLHGLSQVEHFNYFEYLRISRKFYNRVEIRVSPLQVQLNVVVLFLPTLRLSKNLDLDNLTQAFFYF
jgi:hypothetical protein